MTKEQIDAIPRVEARQLLARIPAGQGYDNRVLLAVEEAMNLEWWRGYYAGKALVHITDPVSATTERNDG